MTFQDWVQAMLPKFPLLAAANCRPTSPADESYNCIAWASEDTDRWWWPDRQHQSFWPSQVPREETLDTFVRAYGLQGYTEQTNATLESGKQKVAIYTSTQGAPTHAARQLSDGWWASKLGQNIDVEHELTAIEGPEYGAVAVVLARIVPQRT